MLSAFAMWCHGLPFQGTFLPVQLLNSWRTLSFTWTVHNNISALLAAVLLNIFNCIGKG